MSLNQKDEATVLSGHKTKTSAKRKFNINTRYFSKWSNNMAYVYGLWYTTGFYYKDIFDITMHKKDHYIMKLVAQELEYEGQMFDTVDKRAVRINFSCQPICDDLEEICKKGLGQVPSKYFNSFLRGVFDGCGQGLLLKRGRSNMVFYSDDIAFLNVLLFKIRAELGINGGSIDTRKGVLKFGTKDSVIVARYIYQEKSPLYLEKKREKFKSVLSENLTGNSESSSQEGDVETKSFDQL